MNVVVFALNGCPVSALGPYGNEWIGTPNLDRLAAEGIVFDRHISDCPDPTAARQAWLGEGEVRKANGVRAVLVRANRVVNDAPADFYAGWDEMFDARTGELSEVLATVLDRMAGSPTWLLWIELDRLLPPWDVQQDVFEAYVEDLLEGSDEKIDPWIDPPTGWFDREDLASWELLHRTFAAVVTVFDAELGRVFDLLRERGLDRTAAWVFTADRGLPLGEHGILGPHRPWLHEELVHVPLIVRLPEVVEAGRRVAALTQPADLLPTLAGWLGVAAGSTGFDLGPLMTGTASLVRPFACSALELGPAAECAIRTPEWAYLVPLRSYPDDEPRSAMLFAKPEDRWEVNDLHSREPERADELDRKLRATIT